MEVYIYLILLLLSFSSSLASLSTENGFRVELSHVDSNYNFHQSELLHRAVVRTKHKFSRLNADTEYSTSTNITSTMHNKVSIIGEYTMDLEIGTPPLRYSAIADTGSDLIWTQCSPCKKCVSQPTPIYNPTNSSTFFPICDANQTELCWYNQTYGKGWTSGVLDKETFTFGTSIKSLSVPNMTFMCSNSTSDDFAGSSGIVGLGRGKWSLVSQLKTSKFSYCLTSFLDTNSTNALLLGPSAKLEGSEVKSTPFVKNPPQNTYYYLSLHGISLGGKKVAISNTTFALNSNGTGGIIIDSGTTFSILESEAYQAVLDGIKSIVKLEVYDGPSVGFDLCYLLQNDTSPPKMPNMKFHFEGADMELPVENYMLTSQNFWCLAMFNNTLSGFGGVSIFGNYQQQNMHILYDLTKEMLSFSPAQCDKI